VKDMGLLDYQNHLQPPDALENDHFLEVSSAWRLVDIAGTVTEIDLNVLQVKDMGLLHMHMSLWVYCSATISMVAEIGTK
jgi:hypothetical protein